MATTPVGPVSSGNTRVGLLSLEVALIHLLIHYNILYIHRCVRLPNEYVSGEQTNIHNNNGTQQTK